MNDLDEFLQAVGTHEGREVCKLKGCNKRPATMEEALETPQITRACDHCFRIYIPGLNDRSPRVIKRYKKKTRDSNGNSVEYDGELYEDGTTKINFTIPKK